MSDTTIKPQESKHFGHGITIIYDGACPLCSAYVRRLRLTDAAGTITLVNARDHPALVATLRSAGQALDDGMVVQLGDQQYHGAAAVHVLALMTSPAGWFNRVNYLLFRRRGLARLLYPPLVIGRRVLLWLLRRPPLD
jgi:predicted DCC family thiol-disulfide oxidoreductase YuxK